MIDVAHSMLGTIDVSTLNFSGFDVSNLNLSHFHLDWQPLAQFKQDVTKDLAGGWNGFIKSGQVWALMIGVTVGYLFKSVTG
jgi:hypothetical protein